MLTILERFSKFSTNVHVGNMNITSPCTVNFQYLSCENVEIVFGKDNDCDVNQIL